MYMPNAAAAAVSMRHGLRGQMYGIVSACSSGGNAIGAAARMIQYGDADAAVAGGTEAAVDEFGFACFDAMQALSPEGISRPFDARRNGFVMGEGAGALVLEEYEAAVARGATILGEVIGYGSTADAHHLTAPDPSGVPASRAIQLALNEAGLSAEQIDYINAHGTSTELNDAAETAALKNALGEAAYKVPISSLKSSIGHLLGAAGAVEAVATVQALNARIAPPTLGYGEPDPACDLDYVPNRSRPLPGDGELVGLSNSFAFGGHNVTLAIRGTA
jgi:3-oxoacyl-[acyl-carrier-protein] synthase II